MALISIVIPCFNEEENVRELFHELTKVFQAHPRHDFEVLFVDNCSTDNTVAMLKTIATNEKRLKIIVSARNVGPLRSHPYGMFQARGEAVVMMACDFQDPPELISQFIELWEQGHQMVLAIKDKSTESKLMFGIRKGYYRLLNYLSSIKTIENYTGFGLYDRSIVELLELFRDPVPFFRGMIAELGLPHEEVHFTQPSRRRGISKFSTMYRLYDVAMVGITSLSHVPLRFVTFFGFVSATLSFLIGFFYLAYKLVYWFSFEAGIAPVVIGIFFFGSVQMLALGIIGEYLGSVHTIAQNRPLVIERERVNFD
jgi:polyisoprenyl-phosphate glycosyltransferase